MVSIHNTSEFHNYINNLPTQSEPDTHLNTMLDYIQKNHSNEYSNLIQNNIVLTNKLNNKYVKHTVFLPMNSDDTINLVDYIYKGVFSLDNYKITSLSGKELNVMNNKVNDVDIIVKDIELMNGKIHIIKNKF
jgi:hypothetical protein